jgi:hypothetical protein
MQSTMGTLPPRQVNLLRTLAWGTATCLLLLPAVAMRFTREVDWTAGDFVVMGILLYGCCALLEVAIRIARNSTPYLAASILGIGTGFLTLWINLAVGIIGSENDVANWAFLVVLAIALFGSLATLYRPRGMSTAMFVTAAAQALVAIYALYLGSFEGTCLSLVFAAAWFACGVLFRKAAQERTA